MLYLTFDVIPSRISVISIHLFAFLHLPSYYLSNILGWLISSYNNFLKMERTGNNKIFQDLICSNSGIIVIHVETS